jgi:hypothetical protein
MAYATLELLARRVGADLEAYFQARPAKLKACLRHVLSLLVTAEAPEELERLAAGGEVRGLRTHLDALASHLQDESRLPEALCARYKYRTAEARARKRYRISRRSWDYLHALAKQLGWSPDLRVPLIDYDNYPWHDELEKEFVSVEVVLEARALEGMLIYALEAYLSPRPPRRKGYEVYGIVMGMTRDIDHGRPRDGVTITRYVSVMRSHPQLSAEGHTTSVVPNPRSLHAILSATAAFYPQYQAVGDFHSHLYDDLTAMEGKKGWLFSRSDEDTNVDLARAMTGLGHHLHVTFVTAIARCTQRVTRSRYRGLANTIQISLGNCRVILAAFRSLGSGHLTDSNIRLRLSGAT